MKPDSTISSTLSSTIADEFQSLAIISWLGSGYLIALTATQPLSGKLSDIFGRKASFVIAALIFSIGNLVCGLAGSKSCLILGRVIAGIGGGGCNSISTFLQSDYIPSRNRGLWYGIGTVIYTTGMGSGAVIGGGLNDTLGWRWAFIMLAPVSVFSGIGVSFFLPDKTGNRPALRHQLARIDFAGCVTLVSALALLLIYLNQEVSQAVASQVTAKIALPLSGVLFAGFILVESRWAKEPIIPLSLFKKPNVLATCLSGCFMSMTIYSFMFYVPLYLQLRGYSTSETGVRVLPESIGAGLGSFVTGLIARQAGQYGALKFIAPTLMVLASTGYAVISINSPAILPEIYLFVNGLGFGGLLTVLLLAMLSAVPHKHQATSTSVLLACRSIGATLGVSATGVLFRSRYSQRSQSQTAQNSVAYTSLTVAANPDHHAQADYMYALHGTFQLALGFAIAGFICAMFARNHKLSSSLEENTVAESDDGAEHTKHDLYE